MDRGLQGRDDTEVLREAHREQRVVMTHDSDFGRLAVQSGEIFTGILDTSAPTVSRQWTIAKGWLFKQLRS